MAMVAATVDAGRWHVPQVLQASDPPTAGAVLDADAMNTVRGLMRGAVRAGAAQAANRPGPQVYGQVGLVRTGSGWMSLFIGYRGDQGWPQGVQEDDDVKWSWRAPSNAGQPQRHAAVAGK